MNDLMSYQSMGQNAKVQVSTQMIQKSSNYNFLPGHRVTRLCNYVIEDEIDYKIHDKNYDEWTSGCREQSHGSESRTLCLLLSKKIRMITRLTQIIIKFLKSFMITNS